MTRVSAAKAQDGVRRVVAHRERVIVRQGRKDVAAIVPLEDLALLEELEDAADVEEARRRLADPNEKPIPWEQAKADFGL